MTGLMDREEKLLRLAVDAGATDGEAQVAGAKFIEMLRNRQYQVEVNETGHSAAEWAALAEEQATTLQEASRGIEILQNVIAQRDAQIEQKNAEIAQLKAQHLPSKWQHILGSACGVIVLGVFVIMMFVR